MRLGDLDALKEEVKTLFCPDGYKIMMLERIDNAPTVKTYCYFCGQTEHGQIEKRPQGECKTCKHYKPFRNFWGEARGDGYCSIKRMTQDGELEINVNDDFYCKYYEKGGAK